LKLYRKISDNPSVVWINEEVVTERIDANYYHVSHIQLNKSKIPMLKISTYCSLSKKRFNPNKYDKEYLKYIDISNVNINTGVFEHQLININEAPSRARKKVSKNDIIVSTVRPNRNAVSIINIEDEDLVASTGFAVIECKKNIDNYFLFAVLKTDNSVSQLVRKTSGGLYPAISEQDVMEIEIPIPSPEIQKYIGDKVRKAEELRDEAKKKRNEIEKNFLKMIGLKEEISFTEEKYRWALSNELETISAIPEYYKSKYLVVEKIFGLCCFLGIYIALFLLSCLLK
jgi:type I restriction enzyme S subunit